MGQCKRVLTGSDPGETLAERPNEGRHLPEPDGASPDVTRLDEVRSFLCDQRLSDRLRRPIVCDSVRGCKNKRKQECIPVGCVPPARRPYLPGRGVYLVGGVYLVPGGWCVPGPQGGCTWSGGSTWSRGVYLVPGGEPGPWGVYLVPGGCTWSPGGCTWSQGGTWSGTPPVNRITHTCKNITLPQLRCGW